MPDRQTGLLEQVLVTQTLILVEMEWVQERNKVVLPDSKITRRSYEEVLTDVLARISDRKAEILQALSPAG